MARPAARSRPLNAPPEASTAARAEWGDSVPGFLRGQRWLTAMSAEQRLVLALAAFAALVAVPWLGATGFWDPWEPHYGEVAREMIARGDYIHPWWESAWFFSKPALDLWLMAAGMLVAGTNGPDRWTGVYTEWCVRLPYAAIAATGAILLFVAANRLLGRKGALLGTVALLTSPLFVFLSREAVPDPVFVGLLSSAMACLMIVLFEDARRDGWLVAFYCFVGLATLSKGILGFALPGAVALVYFVITGEWHRLKRLRLGMGALIVLAICGPWYGTMFGFDGRDDEGKNFFQRFIIHDHFQRLAVGVFTSTPGGTFIYFIEQLGFNAFPWVFAFPGAATVLARVQVRPQTGRERGLLFVVLWLLVGFAVFGFSVTKFHHYAFPVLPPLLLLGGLWLEQLFEDGLRAHAGEIFAGGLLYGLIAHDLAMSPKHLTDMFVFNYDRPYPDRETDPRQVFTLLFYAAPAVALSPWLFDRLVQVLRAARAVWKKDSRAQLRQSIADRMAGAPLQTVEAPQDRKVALLALVSVAVAFAIFLGWFQWRRLSPHWTQRDLFWVYTHQSAPDEPIGAYLMNWRGETFYSRNTVKQLKKQQDLAEFVEAPGARKWVLVEQARLTLMRQALGNSARVKVIESRNNKFVLTTVEKETKEKTGAPPAAQPLPGTFGAPP